MRIPPQRALEIVLAGVRPLKPSRRPLARTLGCCLAEDVCADRDMPATDRSAMDGFAVRSADLAALPRTLRLIGEVAAGSGARPRVRPGACARVLTGASVPPGADTVVMVEKTTEDDGRVTFLEPTEPRANIRYRGEEAPKGTVLIDRGTVLGPVQIGLCAAVGKADPKVHPRPRVAVLCTGEELRDAGSRVRPYQLRDSNGPALVAALAAAGFDGASCRLVGDSVKAIAAALKRAAARREVVIVTGGVSVGKYDYVPAALEAVGAKVRFHGVQMKPGAPQLYATLPGGRHIFGLPGNPLSVLTGLHEFTLPALRRLSGVAPGRCRPSMRIRLAAPAYSRGKRTRYVLARLIWDGSAPEAVPLKSRGSADLAAAGAADGAVLVPPGVREIPAGEVVEFRPWRALP